MLLKRGMGNGEWGMGNGEWEIEKWEIVVSVITTEKLEWAYSLKYTSLTYFYFNPRSLTTIQDAKECQLKKTYCRISYCTLTNLHLAISNFNTRGSQLGGMTSMEGKTILVSFYSY